MQNRTAFLLLTSILSVAVKRHIIIRHFAFPIQAAHSAKLPPLGRNRGDMSKTTGYEPNVMEQKSLTDENPTQPLVATSTSSASFATTLMKAGGDSVAKRRHVEILTQSPSKDQLWTELQ